MTQNATVGDAINHAVDKASDGLSQITHALSEAAPKAWSLAVEGIFIQGVTSLIQGVVIAASSFVFFWLANKANKKADWKDGNAAAFLAVGFGLAAIITLLISISYLADSNAWQEILNPQAFLANEILQRAL